MNSEDGKTCGGRANSMRSMKICLVCDFFYPNVGGVEIHLYQLAQCLVELGHKLIIVSHDREGGRCGVRFLRCGVKVYYLPHKAFYNDCLFPCILSTTMYCYDIFKREKVDLVHGHSAFSALAHCAMFHARNMGIATVFTDHSLFGFADVSAILTNKLLEVTLCDTQHVICVSHTSKENTVLRARVRADRVSVIPNAVDAHVFRPSEDCYDEERWPELDEALRQYDVPMQVGASCRRRAIRIAVMCRLVYRKGADLLLRLIPLVCAQHPDVVFVIGGDGPKRIALEQTIEQHALTNRVELLGMVPQHRVNRVLRRCDIFLNTSLTEAFCMAIVEAAACGCFVVTTNVGGIPEVLPSDIATLAAPSVSGLGEALSLAVEEVRKERQKDAGASEDRRAAQHARVAAYYNWHSVAKRTEKVYRAVLRSQKRSVRDRVNAIRQSGPVVSVVFIILHILDLMLLALLAWLHPPSHFDEVPDWSDTKSLSCVRTSRRRLSTVSSQVDSASFT